MKVFAVFGATGQQGSSVIDFVRNDPGLSKQYRIRAITRNKASDKARQLKDDIDVVEADVNSRRSVEVALKGVSAAFVMTTPSFGLNAVEDEVMRAKLIADVAVEQRLGYIIFSTLPGVTTLSDGKYTAVTAFDAKAEAEKYIRTLPLRSAFLSPASFMENLGNGSFQTPVEQEDGTWAIRLPMPATTRIPWIAATADIGKFVGPMLANPDRFEGQTVHAAVALYNWDEVTASLSRFTGRQVVFEQVKVEEFRRSQTVAPDLFTEGSQFYADPGYFGPGTEELALVGSRVPDVRLTTLDEWVAQSSERLMKTHHLST